jgi:hypothetical protein
MQNEIFQILIELQGSKPKIWRRILVPSNYLLSDFHKIIQVSMGWTNSHLHQFIKDKTFYTQRMKDDDMWDERDHVDYKKIKVSDLLKTKEETIIYEYDYGDRWSHDVILEEILPMDDKIKYPVCIGGEMNCPPEDCGGIGGYYGMLAILKQPGHDEYNSYIEWLGGEFDPELFDKDEVNILLRMIFKMKTS